MELDTPVSTYFVFLKFVNLGKVFKFLFPFRILKNIENYKSTKMKSFLFTLCFFSAFCVHAQDYSLIIKAEKILNKNNPNLKKASKLLKKAEKSDYGFCGNAKMSALIEIDYLKAKILFLEGNYISCLQKLEEDEIWNKHITTDSLKVACLIEIHGKEKVVQSFLEKSNATTIKRTTSWDDSFCIALENISYTFCFTYPTTNFVIPKDTPLLEVLKATNFYSLLL